MSVYLEPNPCISYLVGKTSGKDCVFDMGCGCWERAGCETSKDGGEMRRRKPERDSSLYQRRKENAHFEKISALSR
jgi:hypothetical protein